MRGKVAAALLVLGASLSGGCTHMQPSKAISEAGLPGSGHSVESAARRQDARAASDAARDSREVHEARDDADPGGARGRRAAEQSRDERGVARRPRRRGQRRLEAGRILPVRRARRLDHAREDLVDRWPDRLHPDAVRARGRPRLAALRFRRPFGRRRRGAGRPLRRRLEPQRGHPGRRARRRAGLLRLSERQGARRRPPGEPRGSAEEPRRRRGAAPRGPRDDRRRPARADRPSRRRS